MLRKGLSLWIILLCSFMLISCAQEEHSTDSSGYTDTVTVESDTASLEAAALEPALQPARSILLKPMASGTHTAGNEYASVDYSHSDEGYVMVQYIAATGQRIKSQVVGPSTTYTYHVTPGQWEVFPLSDGNGDYQIHLYENITDNRYAQVLAVDLSVTLKDEFAPFLRPNQYVNYENAVLTMDTAAELTQGITDSLAAVDIIYHYVIENISYDYEKAETVTSGYLPDLDHVLSSQKGICFDYAALMTGMLRSLGIPCKLVVGYVGTVYHAWINVWSDAAGWVDGAVYFNGTAWQLMDPTYASAGQEDLSAREFVGNATNYTTKYIY